jgi:hypothetical protein
VPWCEDCGRFYSPPTLTSEGDCPEGHHVAEPGAGQLSQAQGSDRDDGTNPKVPWHFWLLLLALAVYLGWRLVQLVMWLFR